MGSRSGPCLPDVRQVAIPGLGGGQVYFRQTPEGASLVIEHLGRRAAITLDAKSLDELGEHMDDAAEAAVTRQR